MSNNQQTPIPEVIIPKQMVERLALGEITLAQFVGLDRNTLYAIAQIAHYLLDSGKLERARTIYEGLVAADPFDSVFHCHLGAACQKAGDMDTAFDAYSQALKYNYANVEALAGRGEIHFTRGNLTAAVTDLQKAIELDPAGKRPASIRARAIAIAIGELAKQVSKPGN